MFSPITFQRLLAQCQNEFNQLGIDFNSLSNEEKMEKVLSIFIQKIYERSDGVSSVKFSDYLKEETHLDYYFFKLCRKYEPLEKKPKSRKRHTKKFGIFNVDKIENRRSIEVETDKISEEEFKNLIK